MLNCIYEDGTVIPVDHPDACPRMNRNGFNLVDVADVRTTVDVTTSAPVSYAPLVAVALVILLLKRKG